MTVRENYSWDEGKVKENHSWDEGESERELYLGLKGPKNDQIECGFFT